MANRIGQLLGNYRLMYRLGKGGFAEVYLGEHMRLHTQAAIKVLQTQLASDETESFYNEARTIARLVHPHIVRILDFDVEDGLAFLVMDYAMHGTLRQRYPKGVKLPFSTILQLVMPIADALQYAHDEKVIHRDVKPENIFLGRQNEVLLGDFGIATIAQSSRIQSPQDVAGTLSYMAPEQIEAHAQEASDQYALAVVVYEWLCGERPFHGSISELAAKHTSVAPPPLHEHVPDLPRAIEQVVLKALAKDPKERFPSVRAFAQALEQAGAATMPGYVEVSRPSVGGSYPGDTRSATIPYAQPAASSPPSIELKMPRRTFSDYDQLITFTPLDATHYYNRGIAYREIKEYRRAAADFDRAIELATHEQNQSLYLYYYHRGLTYTDLKDFLRAIDDFNQSIQLVPEFSAAYYMRGLTYAHLKKYQQAITNFTHVVALDPNLASAYYQRGIAYHHREDFQKALDSFNRAIALNPEDVSAYCHRALVYVDLQEYQWAIHDFDHAVALNPRYDTAYNYRGLAYFEMREYRRAIADFDRVIALNPGYAVAYNNRGLVYFTLKEYQRAIQDFDYAITLDPAYATAYYNRGSAYFDLEEYEQAIDDYNLAIELDADEAIVYYHRGLAFAELKDFVQAILDFDYVIKQDPTDADAYYNRGLAYFDLNDYQQALLDFDDALRLNPNNAMIYSNRGLAHFKLRDYQQAIDDFDHALNLNPDDMVAYDHREQAYKKLHQRIHLRS